MADITNPYVSSPTSSGYIQAPDLNATTKMNIPPAVQDATDYNSIISGALSSFQQADATLNQANEAQSQGVSSLAKLYADVGLKSTDTAQMEQDKGIAGMQTDVQGLTNTLNGLQAEANIIPLQMQQNAQGQGITDRGLAPLQTAALRENAIKTLTTSSLLQAKQGNLTLAQTQIDRAIQLKYAPLEQAIASKEKLLELNQKYFITPAEKKRAEALQIRLDKEKQDIADKRADDTAMSDTLLKARQGGIPDALATSVQRGIDDGTLTRAQVDMMVGQYTAAIPASAQEYQYAVAHGYKGTYTQYQTEDANRKALAVNPKAPAVLKPITSGGLTYTPSDLSEDTKVLEASKNQGAEADGKYADPNLYKKLHDAWIANGGLLNDFLKNFPPKLWVNPLNDSLPPQLRPAGKKSTTTLDKL